MWGGDLTASVRNMWFTGGKLTLKPTISPLLAGIIIAGLCTMACQSIELKFKYGQIRYYRATTMDTEACLPLVGQISHPPSLSSLASIQVIYVQLITLYLDFDSRFKFLHTLPCLQLKKKNLVINIKHLSIDCDISSFWL